MSTKQRTQLHDNRCVCNIHYVKNRLPNDARRFVYTQWQKVFFIAWRFCIIATTLRWRCFSLSLCRKSVWKKKCYPNICTLMSYDLFNLQIKINEREREREPQENVLATFYQGVRKWRLPHFLLGLYFFAFCSLFTFFCIYSISLFSILLLFDAVFSVYRIFSLFLFVSLKNVYAYNLFVLTVPFEWLFDCGWGKRLIVHIILELSNQKYMNAVHTFTPTS